jgi:hypothetical protein
MLSPTEINSESAITKLEHIFFCTISGVLNFVFDFFYPIGVFSSQVYLHEVTAA